MLFDTIQRVFASLNEANVRYLLAGGFAVAAHGHTRATNDIDLVVALDRENALRTVEALSRIGFKPTAPIAPEDFADRAIRERWKKEKNMLVFQMRTGDPLDAPVDLFVDEPFDFDQAYARAFNVELAPGLAIPVVPFETLIAMKRSAGRPIDLEDIRILRELRSDPSEKP